MAEPISNDTLLELHCAARPFIDRRSMKELEARARLRRAVTAVLRERGAVVPPALANSPEEALDTLRAIVRRCEELKVNWMDVVAVVNREAKEPA